MRPARKALLGVPSPAGTHAMPRSSPKAAIFIERPRRGKDGHNTANPCDKIRLRQTRKQTGSSASNPKGRFLPQISDIRPPMKAILTTAAFLLAATALPVAAGAEPQLEGHWKNPKGSVIVHL